MSAKQMGYLITVKSESKEKNKLYEMSQLPSTLPSTLSSTSTPTVVWVLSAGAGYAGLGLSLSLPLPAPAPAPPPQPAPLRPPRPAHPRTAHPRPGSLFPPPNRAFVWAVSAYPLPHARAVV